MQLAPTARHGAAPGGSAHLRHSASHAIRSNQDHVDGSGATIETQPRLAQPAVDCNFLLATDPQHVPGPHGTKSGQDGWTSGSRSPSLLVGALRTITPKGNAPGALRGADRPSAGWHAHARGAR